MANRLRTFWRTPANRQQVGGTNYERLAEDLDDGGSDLSQVWDREHNKHVVESLLSVARERFGEKAIEAFRRTYLKGESFDEVGESLDMTVNAVVLARSRVLRALRELGQGMID